LGTVSSSQNALVSSRRKSSSAFRTIGEVSAELSLPTHVLRFWESKFNQIKPHKRRGGHRYYRPEDISTIKEIKSLLYDRGYTIKGAQRYLKDLKKGNVESIDGQSSLFEAGENQSAANSNDLNEAGKERIKDIIGELVELRDILNRF